MKKWAKYLLFLVIISSITLNGIYLNKYHSLTNNLFNEYQKQLLIADEALRISVESDDSIPKQQHYLATHRALARARTISEIIGLHNESYRYDRHGELYFIIPYEMDWILEYATYSHNSIEDLRAVSEIFSVYTKHLGVIEINDVVVSKNTLAEIHREINSNNMLPSNITPPTSFYKY